MIKSIVIPRLSELPAEAVDVPQLLDSMSVSFEPVSMVNWPNDYPYCPSMAFRMA